MTDTTMEQNKLIALFMGYTEDQIQCADWCGCNVYYKCEITGLEEMIGANYNSSWDWLMPVVQKIDKLPRQQKPWVQLVDKEDNLSLDICNSLIQLDIAMVFQSVVNYIIWFNGALNVSAEPPTNNVKE